ncbi:MAG TPA: hypothetical protein VFE16_14265 [Candidatus Cybelea sp.]|nr:hypothetical protein [Candidatus Cybelea sp.]
MQRQQSTLTYVAIPVTNSIQTDLISTFPTGTFQPKHGTSTFSIPSSPDTCGYADNGPCNFYDGFGFSGSGTSITIDAKVSSPVKAYTLMNAYQPTSGAQVATIEFVGDGGATVTYPLIGGEDIRDFYEHIWANTLNNGVSGVVARNAFQCDDPHTCLGAGGTGNVNTGGAGKYRVDEQQYSLRPLHRQALTQIVITDTANGMSPILLGLTVESN